MGDRSGSEVSKAKLGLKVLAEFGWFDHFKMHGDGIDDR